MDGLFWAGAVWLIAGAVVLSSGARGYFRGQDLTISRERVAIVLVLLATHSLAATVTAEEVLRDPAVVERVVRGALAGLGLVVVLPMLLAGDNSSSRRRYVGLVALTVYWGVAALSTLYSAAPIVSIGKAFELAAGLAIVWAIAIQPDAIDRLRSSIGFVVFLEAALVGTAVVGFVILPETFAAIIPRPGFIFEATMFAPFGHSNALSASGALVASFALASFLREPRQRSRAGWFSLFLIGTIGVVLASGRQGVVIWMAGVMILLWIHRRRLFVFFLAPAAALIVTTYGDAIWSALVRGRAANVVTLSGRVGMWEAAVDAWTVHPFTGYGYGAGGRFVALAAIGDSTTTNLHSGYVEALVGLGIIGLVPLAWAVWRLARWSFRNLWQRVDTSLSILIAPLLLHASVSKGFAAWLNADFMLFALLVAFAGMATDKTIGRHQLGRSDSWAKTRQ